MLLLINWLTIWLINWLIVFFFSFSQTEKEEFCQFCFSKTTIIKIIKAGILRAYLDTSRNDENRSWSTHRLCTWMAQFAMMCNHATFPETPLGF